jgi:hypothetical protein
MLARLEALAQSSARALLAWPTKQHMCLQVFHYYRGATGSVVAEAPRKLN